MKTKLLKVVSILIPATIVLAGTYRMGITGQAEKPFYSYTLTASNYGTTTRLSIASDGSQGNNTSYFPSLSASGRFVAFDSFASTLVSGDGNGYLDVFVHDKQTGITQRGSIASDGSQGNGGSNESSISADGRYVAFSSWANNLVSGDTNDGNEIFVHDRQTGITERVSIASDGSQANGTSYHPSISANGRFVAFDSGADNLVSGDNNSYADIFVHDRQTGTTKRVSIASNGSQGNNDSCCASISADGRYVVFESRASNLVSGDTNNFCDIDTPFQFDDNCPDVFLHDRETGITQRISIASDGSQGNNYSCCASISADGRYVVFTSYASNLISGDTNNFCDIDPPYQFDDNCPDVFLHDRETGITQSVSIAIDGGQGNGGSGQPSISADGRYVVFTSRASNLVSGDTNDFCDTDSDFQFDDNCYDTFFRDCQFNTTELVSLTFDGRQGNNHSWSGSISANGRYVAYWSSASNLVPGDDNGFEDVFLYDREGRNFLSHLPLVQFQP